MDLLPGIQMRVVPPPMPLTPRPLPPLALRLLTTTSTPRIRAVRLSGLPTLIRDGVRLSRRTAEHHPAQHRDLLRQLHDPGIKPWRPDPRPAQPVHASTPRQRHHRSQARKARPPGHTITINHTTSHARRAANNPQPAAAPLHTHRTHTTGQNQPPHGITEYLRHHVQL